MNSVKQEHDYGCGAACVAFILDIKYDVAIKLLGEDAAKRKGYGCQKLCNVLNTSNKKYRFRKYTPELDVYLGKNYTVVFIKRSPSYPYGHYLCRFNQLWMDPWINLSTSKNIKKAQSGFRKKLPGEPEFIIFIDPETSSG